MSKCVKDWRTDFVTSMAKASDAERPNVVRNFIELARPLVRSGATTREEVIGIAERSARLYKISSLKPAGLFRNLPDDEGPQAA